MTNHTIEIYQDRGGEWRWRMRYRGVIVADSGESYTRKRDVRRALLTLAMRVATARTVEVK